MIQKWLDGFYYFRRRLVARLAFWSIRLFGIEVSITDTLDGRYSLRRFENLNLDSAQSLESLLEIAKECHESAEKRRAHVADKCKTLLTLSSLSVALIGLLLPRLMSLNSWWMTGLFVVSLLSFGNTILLLLVFFDVGAEQYPQLTEEQVTLSAVDLQKSLINRNLQCASSLDDRTDFHVNVYGAARFYFLAAFTTIAVLFSLSFLATPANSPASLVVALRSDPSLMRLLQGPPGPEGAAGKQGAIGPPGNSVNATELVQRLRAEPDLADLLRGPKGDPGHLNEDAIVERILADPRLHKNPVSGTTP